MPSAQPSSRTFLAALVALLSSSLFPCPVSSAPHVPNPLLCLSLCFRQPASCPFFLHEFSYVISSTLICSTVSVAIHFICARLPVCRHRCLALRFCDFHLWFSSLPLSSSSLRSRVASLLFPEITCFSITFHYFPDQLSYPDKSSVSAHPSRTPSPSFSETSSRCLCMLLLCFLFMLM